MSRLEELRKERNLYQKEVADYLGVERTTYNKLETGETALKGDPIIKLCKFYGVTSDYLLGISDYRYTKSPNSQKQVGVKIPVLGNVAAGAPITAIENIDYDDPDAWEEIPADMAESGEYFALRLKGDSMEPRMLNGDVVIVHQQSDVNNGDTAIVKVNGDDATCKKIKKTPQGMMLIPLNPEYEPMFFTHKEIQTIPVEIIGKVVELRGKFR